ncbi:MAG: hypothetical protein IH840_16365, partial [Candidatus Heimdallarchaeota archaeon]|nr:hypothetical protein [Candidatus Heimdallarchaeota archaeon]
MPSPNFVIRVILLFSLILLVVPTQSQASTQKILVLYGSDLDKAEILGSNDNVLNLFQIDSRRFDELSTNLPEFQNYDFLILTSSISFELSENIQQDIIEFLTNTDNGAIFLTPFLDELDNDLLEIIGIEDFIDIQPEISTTAAWEILLNSNLGSIDKDNVIQYRGQLGIFSSNQNVSLTASVVSGESLTIQDEFPFPVIINVPKINSSILVSSLSPISQNDNTVPLETSETDTDEIQTSISESESDSEADETSKDDETSDCPTSDSETSSDTSDTNDAEILCLNHQITQHDAYDKQNQPIELNQLPFSFKQLVKEIIAIPLTSHLLKNGITIPNEGGSSGLPLIPGNLNLDLGDLLIISLISLFIIYSRKIFGLLRWISEKLLVGVVAVAGAFYNIQNRVMNVQEVLINDHRANIMNLLEHVSQYGMHLREIKGYTDLGAGALLWHLQVLEDFGMLVKHEINRNTVFVAFEFETKFDPRLKEIELGLRSKYTKSIIEVLAKTDENQTLEVSELMSLTHLSRKIVKRSLNKFKKYELIDYNKKSDLISIDDRFYLEELQTSIQLRENVQRVKIIRH